ncbi:MAG: hypothetical protein C5B57_08650 [Blastocatellia bacterium]|nr:MAG: hypothetical protein C5B57_08650 [Blastocatellia bacterium]
MAQRSIEVLIGRLITDEAFRDAFLANRALVLQVFHEAGHELTPLEIAAVLCTPAALWTEIAEQIDCRLQKANLSKEYTL